jgi:excisionase family DNA binding protein
MTVKEAAEHSGKSMQTIYNYIHSGKLSAFQNGKSFDINLDDLELVFGNNGDESDDSNLVQILKKQLEEKDEQIRELHQLLAIAHKNVDRLTEQNQLMLEDMRKPKPMWDRVKARLGWGSVGA